MQLFFWFPTFVNQLLLLFLVSGTARQVPAELGQTPQDFGGLLSSSISLETNKIKRKRISCLVENIVSLRYFVSSKELINIFERLGLKDESPWAARQDSPCFVWDLWLITSWNKWIEYDYDSLSDKIAQQFLKKIDKQDAVLNNRPGEDPAGDSNECNYETHLLWLRHWKHLYRFCVGMQRGRGRCGEGGKADWKTWSSQLNAAKTGNLNWKQRKQTADINIQIMWNIFSLYNG